MIHDNRQLVRAFFAALPSGELPHDMLAPGMTIWAASSGTAQAARYLQAIRLLATVFAEPAQYRIVSLTAEEDRVVAEVAGQGVLVSGETYRNDYVLIFRIRDGQIASIVEHCDPKPVEQLIRPLMQATIQRQAAAQP